MVLLLLCTGAERAKGLSDVIVRLRVAARAKGALVRVVPTGVLLNPPLCGRTGGRAGGAVVGLMGFDADEDNPPLSSIRLPYPPTLTHVVLCSSLLLLLPKL